jgi:hypothetical protein
MMAAKIGATEIEFATEEAARYTTQQPTSSQTRVPSAAKWLGALGTLPFIFLAIAGPLLDGPFQERAFFALAAYGAVILSFLGGIHWGLEITGFGPAQSNSTNSRRLAYSVVPSLIGWGALFLPRPHGLLFLAVAFACLLVLDSQASQKAQAPAWYLRLRWPLTAVVVASLMLGALA